MGRKIIVCCDGTNNQFGKTDTNVVRLVRALRRSDQQIVYYDPGVGTLASPGNWLSRRLSILYGLAFGAGLTQNVVEAYEFLMNVWRPGDEVFLFGFSRGAYTVRVLAGMLHTIGLLGRGQTQLLPYALRIYRSKDEHDPGNKYTQLCDDFRRTFAQHVPESDDRHFRVRFVGVWDTVSSVGVVWSPKSFAHTYHNPSIATARHAISLDERRWFFRQNTFSPEQPDLRELWFSGVHCDIGGGYEKTRGSLWRVTFDWMVAELKPFLEFDPKELSTLQSAPPVPDNAWRERINDSLTFWWWFAEFIVKPVWNPVTKQTTLRWGAFGTRFLRNAVLHSSVLRRVRDEKAYRPQNLPANTVTEIEGLSDGDIDGALVRVRPAARQEVS